MVVLLWRLRLEVSLNPKVQVNFVKKKRNKKVSARKHER